MEPPLASWPWENLGTYKYLLCAPLLAKAVGGRAWESGSPDRWCFLLLLLFVLRAATYHSWGIFSNMLFLNRRRVIVRDGVDYEQIDKEWHWDNFLILQLWLAAMALYAFPSLRHLPLWDARGAAVALLLHVAATEPLFYLLHRALHREHLFSDYHSLHHSIRVLQPYTAGLATPLEILAISGLMAVPVAAACAAGLGSACLLFGYALAFDFLRAMGHCNVEVFPGWLFETVPAARYLIGTPTYHTIHHTDKDSNFCLFMPLFDLLGGTLNGKSWELQEKNSADLRRLLLQAPGPPVPDLGRPQTRLPLLLAVCERWHQQADRDGHPEGRQDGRQGHQPRGTEQERVAERRGHAVRDEAPGPAGARRPRQHADSGGDPTGDPRGHGGGVPDRRHVQARPRHRALPLQEEGPRHDAHGVGGEVPEGPGGGAAGGPAVPGPRHQVPVGPALQDVDRGEVAVAGGPAVGAGGDALPPVRGAAHPPLPPGLHLRRSRRHAPAGRRAGPRRLRVHPGPRRRARVPRRRRRALPRGVRGPRGRRHRRRPHRRRLGGRAAPRPAPRLIHPSIDSKQCHHRSISHANGRMSLLISVNSHS